VGASRQSRACDAGWARFGKCETGERDGGQERGGQWKDRWRD
jgi:hypothetical protein